ncbi:unnamed protein product, partial [Scytosiphon promiscuus]
DLGAFEGIQLKHPVADSEGSWYEDVPASLGGGGGGRKRGKKGKAANSAVQEGSSATASPAVIAQARAAGKSLLEAEVAAWTAQRARHASGDDKWVEQVLRGGTLSDKVAALTLQVQESPVHRLSVLDGLLDLGLKKERRTAQMALEALKDLFVTNLLPDARRLVAFESRPLMQALAARLNEQKRGKHGSFPFVLLVSGWRARLREVEYLFFPGIYRPSAAMLRCFHIMTRFYRMVGAIEAGSRDTVENFKRFSLEAAKDLLEAKPEAEGRLLALLVIHLLQRLLMKHPAMKGVVVREVQQYLHRPGLQPKAVYAGIIFLNQVWLCSKLEAGEDGDIASSLVQTYLRLFEAATSSPKEGGKGGHKHKHKKAAADAKNASFYAGDAGARLLSALLTGVNRARPYLPPGDPGVEGRTASLFRVAHTGGFSTATQALSLLFQVGGEGRPRAEGAGPISVKSSVHPASMEKQRHPPKLCGIFFALLCLER